MGMDYIGRNGNFHLNWTGHTFMASLLDQLGANLDEWSGSNDGDWIKPGTCGAWARLLRENVDKVRVLKVPDGTGFDDVPLVEGKTAADLMSTHELAGILFQVSLAVRKVAEMKEPAYPAPEAMAVEPLSAEGRTWILEFAEFLEACGGCEQC